MASEKKCCVPNCGSDNEILHKFPNPAKDPLRFRTWLYNIGGDIISLENLYIFQRLRVCHRHFEICYHTRSKKLTANAIPRLCLPDAVKTPNVDNSTTVELPSVTKTEEDVNNPGYECDNPDDVDTGIHMITEDEGTPSKSLGSLLVGDRTRNYSMPSTINQPKLLIESGRNIKKESTVNNLCETTDILAPIYQPPNKHVLQLRLIDNSTLDEPIYEVITDVDDQTEDNNKNSTQEKTGEHGSKGALSKKNITETTLPPEENHTPLVADTSLVKAPPSKNGSTKDNTERYSLTEELDMLLNEKDKGPSERHNDKHYWKRKLLYIVHNSKFCGICLDAEADMNRLNDEFEIVDNEQTHNTTLLNIVEKVFKEIENIAFPLICDNCTKKLIQSYIFIYNTEETTRKLNNYLNEIYSKTCYVRNNVLAKSHEAFKVHNAVIAFDNEQILQNFDNNKQKKDKKETDQNKKETEDNKKAHRIRRKFRCVSCNIILPSHRAWKLHESTTHKQNLRCIICLQSYRTQENLTKHYKIHLKSNNAAIALDNKEILHNFDIKKQKKDKMRLNKIKKRLNKIKKRLNKIKKRSNKIKKRPNKIKRSQIYTETQMC